LRAARIPGDFLEWADPVCQGPVRELDEAAYVEERRAWLSAAWDIPRAELDRKLQPISALLAEIERHDEVTLWFEHDLFDQSMLMQVLAGLADAPHLHDRLRLVSIDRHPDVRRFIGLGQLRPEQLSALWHVRQLVAPEAYSLARTAWAAYRAPSPDGLRNGDWRSEALPFLAGAIDRHLREFPDPRDGLGVTQRLTVQTISELCATRGVAYAIEVFQMLISAVDSQPWYGDSMWWAYLRELAGEPGGLITMVGEFPAEQLQLTMIGDEVLRGQRSWLRLATPDVFGPSRWRGGVEVA
jgi:hypothetical protein